MPKTITLLIPEEKQSSFTKEQLQELAVLIAKKFDELMEERDNIGFQTEGT